MVRSDVSGPERDQEVTGLGQGHLPGLDHHPGAPDRIVVELAGLGRVGTDRVHVGPVG